MNKSKKRYIDSDVWIENLREEQAETSNEKRRLYLNSLINAIDCRPTLDEKEIIRKPLERIIGKLEGKKWGTSEWRDKWRDEIIGECIEVVKEEGGIE